MGTRKRAGGLKCRDCHRPIVLLDSPFTGKLRPFEPSPVNGRTFQGVDAFPAENRRAYRLRDLVEELMVRRECSRSDAEAEAYDMDWYVLHRCPNEPPGAREQGAEDELETTGGTR